ncbi:MAG: polysaccharide biosynthesis C-terminal domain-containing protein [Bacteroidetes bacterium]|nr:polysaccharide biosynthesis C-terminal domain-containing protein [Bacteroidota bacterium]
MISKKFLASSFIYTFIGALPLASSIILLPFYTNLLSISQFGELALYIGFTFLIQVVVNFGLDTSIGVHYFEYRENKKELSEYIGTVVALLLLIGIFFTAVSLLAGNLAFEKVFAGSEISFFPFGFMSVLTAIFNSFFKTYSNLLITQQRPKLFFWVNFFNFILTIGISLAGLYLYPHSLIGPMWGRLLSGVGIFLLAFYFFASEFGIHFKIDLLKGMWSFCFPVAAYFILMWIVSYIDRYIINDYLTTSDVGIYDFAMKCTLGIDFLQMGLSNAIQPKIFSIWKEKNISESTVEVNRYFNAFTAITVLLIPATVFIMPVVVPLLVYKPQYYDAFNYLPLLALGFVFRGLFNMYLAPVYFFKKTKVLTKVFFLSSVIQVALMILFIKQWGVWGVVWAGLLTKPVQVFFLWLESRKIFQFRFNKTKLLLLPVIFSMLVILADRFIPFNYILLVSAGEIILVGIFVLLIYRNELKITWENLTKKTTQ